jgi:group I intron endonuclease
MRVLISKNYNVFDEGWNGCGIYMCRGDYISETLSQPIYVGSSLNLRQRIEGGHLYFLNRKKHSNKPLQFSWNKHNKIEGFSWHLLELCEPEKLLTREQYYLDLYRPFVDELRGFNIAKDARAPTKGRKMPPHSTAVRKKISIGNTGKILSKETKQRISLATTGEKNPHFGKFHSVETKLKISKANKGNKFALGAKRSEEYKRKSSESRKGKIPRANPPKHYTIVSPSGNIIRGTNISELCRTYNLSNSHITNVLKGKRKSHKGWRTI